MVEHATPIRRSPRPGRPDGTSEQGRYVARWVDEDTGPHEVCLSAGSEQEIRDVLEPLIGSNSLIIHRVRA